MIRHYTEYAQSQELCLALLNAAEIGWGGIARHTSKCMGIYA